MSERTMLATSDMLFGAWIEQFDIVVCRLGLGFDEK
jgi:hypothetical protein